MSLFFNSEPMERELTAAIRTALVTDPQSVPDAHRAASDAAKQVRERVAGSFAVGRFVAALVFLALLFAAGIYTAEKPELKEWSTVLLHTFEVALGGMVGLIIGERARKS